MMRMFLLRLWLCLLLITPALAQARPAPLHPALWKISRHGTTIWLFGTIHLLPPGTRWLNGPVARAADSASEIATEIDDPDGSRTSAAIAARASLPPGTHLSDLIQADERAALTERLSRYGIALDRMDGNKPWYAAAVLSILPLSARGYDVHNGVEAALYAREAARKVRRTGIETPEGQIALLDGLPQASQLAYLKAVIDRTDEIDGAFAAMFTAWGKGDAPGLARLMNADEAQDDPLLIERLITTRNHRFAEWVVRRLTRPGTVFMAIGAGHLAGADSVQRDLARAGIRVERVQ